MNQTNIFDYEFFLFWYTIAEKVFGEYYPSPLHIDKTQKIKVRGVIKRWKSMVGRSVKNFYPSDKQVKYIIAHSLLFNPKNRDLDWHKKLSNNLYSYGHYFTWVSENDFKTDQEIEQALLRELKRYG